MKFIWEIWVKTPKGLQAVAVAPRVEKPKFYETELAALIRDGTRYDGWSFDKLVTVSSYMKSDFSAEHQQTFAKLRAGLSYNGRLASAQIATFAQSIGMGEHVWNQAAIDAAERERQEQKSKATLDALGVIVKAATNLNRLMAHAGKLPNAEWHEQFHANSIGENCAAVEKLLAAEPFTSQDVGLRIFHVRNLIISKLAPAAETTSAARPAPVTAAEGREEGWKNEWRADASLRRDFPKLAAFLAYKRAQPGARMQAENSGLEQLESLGEKYMSRFAPQYAISEADAIGEGYLQSGAARVSGRQPAAFVPPAESATITSAADYEQAFKMLSASERAEYGTAKAYAAFQKANRAGSVNIAA